MLKPLVCTPAYDGKVDYTYSMSMVDAAKLGAINGVDVNSLVMANGAFIDLARNMMVDIFLKEGDWSHLFFIDADLGFDANAMIGLVGAQRPCVAGLYRRRQEPEDYPVRLVADAQGQAITDDGGFIKADRVPTGFLCIERVIVEEMAADAPRVGTAERGVIAQLFYTKIESDDGMEHRFIGEDFAWSDDYVARYGPIDVFPNIDFNHAGHDCNYYRWLDRQLEAVA